VKQTVNYKVLSNKRCVLKYKGISDDLKAFSCWENIENHFLKQRLKKEIHPVATSDC
jgi:hypothetical protein